MAAAAAIYGGRKDLKDVEDYNISYSADFDSYMFTLVWYFDINQQW